MTKYNVFRRTSVAEGRPVFALVGTYDANDAKGAVRAAVIAMPEEERESASTTSFSACPASSWQELTPKVKTETAVSF